MTTTVTRPRSGFVGTVLGMADYVEDARSPGRILQPIVDFAACLSRRIMRPFERARVLNELSALDDRLLADIGLTRGDIPAIVAGARRDGGCGILRGPAEADNRRHG